MIEGNEQQDDFEVVAERREFDRNMSEFRNNEEMRRVSEINRDQARKKLADSMMKKSIREKMATQLLLNFKMKKFDECSICMCPIDDGAEISILGCNNNHYFHKECLNQWINFNQNPQCPLCRKDIEKDKIKTVTLKKMVTVKDEFDDE